MSWVSMRACAFAARGCKRLLHCLHDGVRVDGVMVRQCIVCNGYHSLFCFVHAVELVLQVSEERVDMLLCIMRVCDGCG